MDTGYYGQQILFGDPTKILPFEMLMSLMLIILTECSLWTLIISHCMILFVTITYYFALL